jgi:hypothetical protein
MFPAVDETAVWYRYIDMTPKAEAHFRFIQQTIDTELAFPEMAVRRG